MIVAKLSREGVDDQFFSLEPGQHRLGSDFSCEVALIHPALAPEHLTLKVGEDSVSILPHPGAVATLIKHKTMDPVVNEGQDPVTRDEENAIVLNSEQWTPWYLGDRLVIADISIELEGVKPEEFVGPHIGQRVLQALPATPRSRALIAVAVLVTLAGLVNFLLANGPESTTAAHAKMGSQSLSAAVAAVDPSTGLALIREKLTALGVQVEKLANKDGKWQATLRVHDTNAREKVEAKLGELGIPLLVNFYVDEEIATAVELIASNLGTGSRVLDCRDGVVTLSAMNDPALREKLVQALKSDVQGLADVHFQHTASIDIAALKKRVSGLFPGTYPYIVIDDGSIVRPGETVAQGATLIAISNRYFIIEVDGKKEKVIIK